MTIIEHGIKSLGGIELVNELVWNAQDFSLDFLVPWWDVWKAGLS